MARPFIQSHKLSLSSQIILLILCSLIGLDSYIRHICSLNTIMTLSQFFENRTN